MQYEYTFVTYEEAQRLLQTARYAEQAAPTKEVKYIASCLGRKLELARPQGYDPFPGYQLALTPREKELLDAFLNILELEPR